MTNVIKIDGQPNAQQNNWKNQESKHDEGEIKKESYELIKENYCLKRKIIMVVIILLSRLLLQCIQANQG